MDQKQRNKIAWVLAIVLVPLLIYLLTTNIAKVRKTPSPQKPAAGQVGVSPSPAAMFIPPGVIVQPPTQPAAAVESKISAEQKRIAAQLPENNPFNPLRGSSAKPPPITAAPAASAPPPAPAADLKLTAIMARGGGRVAMINGRFLGEGDRIANWTIIKVTAAEVLLDNGAEKKALRLR